MSSETWSKVLLLVSTIVFVISSAYTLRLTARLHKASALPSTTSPFPSSRDELKPFVVQGILCVALSIVAIAASFIKRRCVIRIVFLAIIVVELYAVYTNRTAMHAGFLKCHEQHELQLDIEEQCLFLVQSLFGSVTIIRVCFLALIMCAACKTEEALVGEQNIDAEVADVGDCTSPA